MSPPESSASSTPQRGAAVQSEVVYGDTFTHDIVADSAAAHDTNIGSSASVTSTFLASTANKQPAQGTPKMSQSSPAATDSYSVDKILARFTEQQLVLDHQGDVFKRTDGDAVGNANGAGSIFSRNLDHASSSSSLPLTPATDGFPATAPATRPASATLDEARPEADEVLHLKLQLAQAQSQISKLGQELARSHSTKTDPDLQCTGMPRNLPSLSRESTWMATDDSQSDSSDAMSSTAFNRARGIWGNPKATFSNPSLPVPVPAIEPSPWTGGRVFNQGYADAGGQFSAGDGYRGERLTTDSDLLTRPSASRRGQRLDNRLGAPHQYGGGFGGMTGPVGHFDSISTPMPLPSNTMSVAPGLAPMSMGVFPPYQQQPIGTTLSPHASEFTSNAAWKNETMSPDAPTYLPATEPLNYRRLLDKNVSANWKYIVDKIVCNNDQQASIFLQQKLKVGSPEQKYDIVEAIVAQAYPLMVNRFGNFLVQRCFEHGTPEQVIKIATAIRGNTLNLSMDPFGCHVVQKAFDSVPEEYKAIMVHELLRRIPETVIHRYACHVWQKLFELRWTESPPQIMKFVNEALRGMWHEVALGETGSLVVQNIFENCLEEDKRPCIEEVLANIDIVAHGQFGNWCIQHVCEHGAPPDRSRAVDHVIRYAAEYSTDQFASKVVEKCLKIGGADFLGRYLGRVCEGRRDRTRIPLIDIASDQYGNYLVQWILNNASPQHREMVAAHIRKHMVSLRGSKFGSRVGMLCTNHAVTTRPGPGVGPGIGGRMGPGPRFGGSYR
ncbi:Pumilio-family RNA binding repeat protein [Ophiocordyceps camponoti-floridani]|uniref:Pumilio-family RNA binding repeat protein n=1 Tax=Ophiocordyceps camponoti-floridani TaxID=2030778 RepID=A0A8H4Q997_9HYPO|nr:Pumilio-family RNA binding repeat protein [Ophiocordyceps camponoti-floridani]